MISDTEILQSALKKALDKGWLPNQFQAADIPYIDRTWRNIVFTHEFARFLWGWELVDKQAAWQHHLQQLVLAENPILYLKENTCELGVY